MFDYYIMTETTYNPNKINISCTPEEAVLAFTHTFARRYANFLDILKREIPSEKVVDEITREYGRTISGLFSFREHPYFIAGTGGMHDGAGILNDADRGLALKLAQIEPNAPRILRLTTGGVHLPWLMNATKIGKGTKEESQVIKKMNEKLELPQDPARYIAELATLDYLVHTARHIDPIREKIEGEIFCEDYVSALQNPDNYKEIERWKRSWQEPPAMGTPGDHETYVKLCEESERMRIQLQKEGIKVARGDPQ
jgi:hypothetical protein